MCLSCLDHAGFAVIPIFRHFGFVALGAFNVFLTNRIRVLPPSGRRCDFLRLGLLALLVGL